MTQLNTFTEPLAPPWSTHVVGSGNLDFAGETLRFVNGDTTSTAYTNAQIDDYQKLARRDYLWRPPLRLTVRARFSHPSGTLRGTAGFGFWNDPFLMTGGTRPALPRVIWFFYSSPPSNMQLALDVPGFGWKAATLDAIRWPFFALLPTAPVAVPLMHLKPLYRLCWPIGQRAIHVSEALVAAPMTDWHTYVIEWHEKTAHFSVDGETVLSCRTPPRGPLGTVIWLDNQYMVVTPWGQFGYGLVAGTGAQWMELSQVELTSL